ncbi:MAG: helix-turn-helix domain-containing protein [Leucobacter sp.]
MSTVEMPIRPGEVERHYPVSEVARLLGMSREWVYQRLTDGTFVTANFGDGKSKKRIPASSVQAFIDAHTYSNKMPGAVTPGNDKSLGR